MHFYGKGAGMTISSLPVQFARHEVDQEAFFSVPSVFGFVEDRFQMGFHDVLADFIARMDGHIVEDHGVRPFHEVGVDLIRHHHVDDLSFRRSRDW